MLTFSGYDDDITWENTYDFSVRWKVSNNFTISTKLGFAEEIDNSQYIFQETVNDKKEYVVGKN